MYVGEFGGGLSDHRKKATHVNIADPAMSLSVPVRVAACFFPVMLAAHAAIEGLAKSHKQLFLEAGRLSISTRKGKNSRHKKVQRKFCRAARTKEETYRRRSASCNAVSFVNGASTLDRMYLVGHHSLEGACRCFD